MKKLRLVFALTVVVLAVAGCSAHEYYPAEPDYIPNGAMSGYMADSGSGYTSVVTVKKDDDGQVYLWLGEKYRLDPHSSVPYEKQYRAMASLRQSEAFVDGRARVYVRWVEPIDDGTFTTDTTVPGSDGIDINLQSWITTSDDGYLTLHYTAKWGQHPVHHDFYLVAGTDPSDPYTLELRHNANGDPQEVEAEGIINFDLNSLPDTGETAHIIHLKWKNCAGEAEAADFGFKTRK